MKEVDLFGSPTGKGAAPKKAKTQSKTNDMDLVQSVLKSASGLGYALIGRSDRVYRLETAKDIVAVPAYEAEAVRQLIEAGMLVVGGEHRYRHRNTREGSGRAVLVPKKTKVVVARWAALKRPSSWGPVKEGL